MLDNEQAQQAKDNATAIQAARDVNITQVGLSYSEAREVALDVFRANFYDLAGQAKQIAQARAEEITEKFLSGLKKEFPDGFTKSQDPDFQHALFTVQKEYARTGDKELGDLLVDILVDRSKQEQRDILQIVLNESLNVAPKLTEAQVAILTIIFVSKYTQNFGIGNHMMLGEYLDKHLGPFANKVVKNAASYQHLEFTGCGSQQMLRSTLEEVFGTIYQGLFLKGFDEKELETRNIPPNLIKKYFIRCLNDNSKIQVGINSKEILEKSLNADGIVEEERVKIISLFDLGKMSDAEIKAKIIELRPFMSQIFDAWDSSPMGGFSLTSVGMAIGHANLKRLIGKFANLSIWIN